MLTMIGRKTHYFQFGAVHTNKPRCFCALLAAVPTQPTAHSPSLDEENAQCSQQDRSRRSSHKPKKSSSQLHRSSRRAQDSSGTDTEEPEVLSENHHSNRPSTTKMVTTPFAINSHTSSNNTDVLESHHPSALSRNSTTDGLNGHDKLYPTTDHLGGLVTHDKLATVMAVMTLTPNLFLSFYCSALPSRC